MDASNLHEQEIENFNQALEEQYKPVLIYEYTDTAVDRKQFLQLYCRGSSQKEKIDVNQRLQVFFLHQECIYSWTEIEREVDGRGKKMKYLPPVKVSRTDSTKFYRYNNDSFFFLENKKRDGIIVEQEIRKVEISFSSCDLKTVYKETVSFE